ncbi:MAG TPA: tetratricopeptide repeat protein, partial [Chryseolinea sp.]|nr:tetratricopeptide repeat protein [Chryseolinea sp.]
MKKISFLFLLLSSSFIYGQKTPYEKLERQLKAEKSDTEKLEILSLLVKMAFARNLNSALAYAKQGAQLADEMNDTNWQPIFYEMEGQMHSFLLKFDSAKLFLNKAITGYLTVNNKSGQAHASFKLSWVLKRTGEKEKAMGADLNGLRLMEQLDDKKGIAVAYERISDGLWRQGRMTESMDYAKKSMDLCEKNNFPNELAYAWFNLGNVYIAMDSNRQSLEFYSKAVEAGQLLKFDPVFLIHFIGGRGNALKRLTRYHEALEDYNYMYDVASKINYVNAIAVAIANLGEVNMRTGNYRDALKYQLETVRLQERDGNLTNLTENYEHVSTIYEKLGNYQLALEYHKKARLMRDRVASVQSDTTMSRLLTQYQAEKKEATIAAQQSEISQQKKVQWLSSGVAVLLAGFLVLGHRNLRSRSKSNKLLAAKNAENELLLKEIHHRVKNNLEVVSSLLALQSAQIDDPNTKEAMLAGQNRVHSI